MTKPRIKLREGWTWGVDGDDGAGWYAFDGDTNWVVVDDRRVTSTMARPPVDVVLAVIAANAPEALREFLAGLATPRDRTKPPPGWMVDEQEVPIVEDDDEGVVYYPCPLIGSDGMEPGYLHYGDCIAAMHAHMDAAAAGCYPEMAARIAELDDMWVASTAALDQMIGERNDALARIAELEAALRVATDRECDALEERDDARSRIAELERQLESLVHQAGEETP